MGNCGSTEEEKKATDKSKAIDKTIKDEVKQRENAVKLLLLGSGESGKSTVLKQFKLIHGTGFSAAEKAGFRPAIVSNVIVCAKTLVNAMETLQIPYCWTLAEAPAGSPVPGASLPKAEGSGTTTKQAIADPSLEMAEDNIIPVEDAIATDGSSKMTAAEFRGSMSSDAVYLASIKAAEVILNCQACFGEGESVPAAVLEAMQTIWGDPGIKYCYTRASEFQLMDSCEYYMADLPRFLAADYVPTNQDILAARIMTTTITETKFRVENVTFRIFDVGGQRSERKKWAPYFDDCSAIIFISAISAYDQTCFEDNKTNRMVESLNLFGSICNHPLFKNTSMIVFLNKIDLFRKKLPVVPIKTFFPNYSGKNVFEPASEYFASRFMALNKSSEKKIYIHFTWATDTKQIRTVLITVNAIILRLNLEAAGI